MRRYLDYGSGGGWVDCCVVHLRYTIRRVGYLTVGRCRSTRGRDRGWRIGYYNGSRRPSDVDYIWPVAWYLFTSVLAGGAPTAVGGFCMSASSPLRGWHAGCFDLTPVCAVPVDEGARREEEEDPGSPDGGGDGSFPPPTIHYRGRAGVVLESVKAVVIDVVAVKDVGNEF